jgi:uncharacterized membrane protein
MWNNFLISLFIMGKGMLGIFTTVIIIMICIIIIKKFSSFDHKKDQKEIQQDK